MANIKIQLLDDGYRLVVNGEESDVAGYGEPLECVLDGRTYLSLVDVSGDSDDEVQSVLDSWVYEISEACGDVEIEDVDSESVEASEAD